MTKSEFEAAAAKLLKHLRSITPPKDEAGKYLWDSWKVETTLDYGWTIEFAAMKHYPLDFIKVISLHGWSWDGTFKPEEIQAYLESPRGTILHLSDPIRPDYKGEEL